MRQSKIVTADACEESEAGYTLVEMLVVLVILVLLASLVGPRLVNYLSSSRSKTARVQIESLASTVEAFAVDNGRYPTNAEGLDALVTKPSGLASWHGPYLNSDAVPLDPWARAYHYRIPGKHKPFEIYSLGRDDKVGGDGEDADISN